MLESTPRPGLRPEEVAPSGQLTSEPNVHILLSLPANVDGEKTNDDTR